MSDDLVKRLWQLDMHPESAPRQAADRIEELEAHAERAEAERDEERVRSHREGYAQGKSAGDTFAESIRQHVLKLEADVERLRE